MHNVKCLDTDILMEDEVVVAFSFSKYNFYSHTPSIVADVSYISSCQPDLFLSGGCTRAKDDWITIDLIREH